MRPDLSANNPPAWLRRLLWAGRATSLACVVLWCVTLRWSIWMESQFTDAWGIKHGAVFGRSVALWGRRIDATAKGWPSTNRQWQLVVTPGEFPPTFFPDYTTGGATGAGSIPLPWIIALILVPEGIWRIARKAERSTRAFAVGRGVCPACNYSRQGLSPSSPCPECGETLTAAEQSTIAAQQS
ncbi:MAG TPA: hypothetical protein VHN77_13730 [Phycisphaerales bacterium]|nr:hypothetical protein [Phycisphaerales bacterium]